MAPPKKNLKEHYDDGSLDLSLSELQEVPVREIAAIPKAINLDLSSNVLVSLPKSFASSLTHLVKLDLSQNQIESLPENFGLLVSLKHLDLDNNKLVSLPLSFGNLKSLRWLDLKQNPLMPKLAQIAGLCLDAKQCQAAAKNVVVALRDMQNQVNAEFDRRKEVQMKKLEKEEEIAKNHSKENQQPKKKKKKGANASSESIIFKQINGEITKSEMEKENDFEKKLKSVSSVPLKNTAQKRGFFSTVGNIVSSLIKIFVMTALLFVFCGFLLSLFDENLYTTLKNNISMTIQSNIPKAYQKQWDRGLLVSRQKMEKWTAQVVALSVHYYNRTYDYCVLVSSDERVQQYLESIKSGWHIMWIWIEEVWTTVSVKLKNTFADLPSPGSANEL